MSPPPQTPNPCEIAYISHANNSESVRGDFSDCRISEVGLLVQKCCSPKGQQKPNSMLQMRGWEHSDRRGVSQLRHLLRAHQKAVAQTTLASLCCFSFNSEELLNIADLSKKDTAVRHKQSMTHTCDISMPNFITREWWFMPVLVFCWPDPAGKQYLCLVLVVTCTLPFELHFLRPQECRDEA